MERLETKKINGHTYYYYSEWGWVNGKCRRIWQRYLGKLEDIVKACEGGGPAPLYADVFQWGLPAALWKEISAARVVEEIDALCPKRNQGLSTGEYIGVASVNRAIRPNSKRSMWSWFSQTVLLRYLPDASKEALSSQRFWDHMDRIKGDKPAQIWKNIIKGVAEREEIDLSSVSYDGANFYTFIDTFNVRCQLAKRGKNKQGQSNLRQVSYALFCSADGHMPLFYDVSEGNRNDAKQFPVMLEKFNTFLQEVRGRRCGPEDTTLIFDKGNNSPANFEMIDSMGLNFVGSVKLGEHKELAQISNGDERFRSCEAAGLDGTKAFRVKKTVYTHLGKNIIISNRESWDDPKIIEAYRSQFIIENVFKEMKDRTTGSWWPMNHWTDSKIAVHGLYCTIALLLRALMLRRARAAQMQLSMKRLLSELDDMRQVINIFPKKRRQKTERRQAVLSRTSELQDKLIDALGLREDQNALLG